MSWVVCVTTVARGLYSLSASVVFRFQQMLMMTVTCGWVVMLMVTVTCGWVVVAGFALNYLSD
jgi:hypothetical protein